MQHNFKGIKEVLNPWNKILILYSTQLYDNVSYHMITSDTNKLPLDMKILNIISEIFKYNTILKVSNKYWILELKFLIQYTTQLYDHGSYQMITSDTHNLPLNMKFLNNISEIFK